MTDSGTPPTTVPASYRLIAADGKEYGPVDLAKVREWITDGRAGAQTLVRRSDGAEWVRLGALPEFAPLFAPRTFPTSAGAPRKQTHPLAITGLVMGVLAFTFGCCCYGLPFNVLGVIFSIIALVQIRAAPQTYEGTGAAIAGLVLSLWGLLAALLFALFATSVSLSNLPPRHWPRV